MLIVFSSYNHSRQTQRKRALPGCNHAEGYLDAPCLENPAGGRNARAAHPLFALIFAPGKARLVFGIYGSGVNVLIVKPKNIYRFRCRAVLYWETGWVSALNLETVMQPETALNPETMLEFFKTFCLGKTLPSPLELQSLESRLHTTWSERNPHN